MVEVQKILVVDDEPRNVKIALLSLGSGWDIKTATSGEQALEILQTFIPDLILLDIMMPGIDGYGVCAELKKRPEFDLTKIVLVSGKALLEERLKGYELGADDYITKPYIPEELLAKTRVFLRLAQVERDFKSLNQSLETEVRLRTDQLMQAKAHLVQSAKMSALGEMAGGVAHEINTPLAVIMLTAQQIQDFLGEQPVDVEAIGEFAKRIEATAERVAKIIRGLRSFSRDGSRDNFENSSLKEIVMNTASLCSEKAKNKGVSLDITDIPDDLLILCQSTQISQVLLNLISNACDAVENCSEKWVRVSLGEDDSVWKLTVTDSGKGVPKEVRDKIFQPFFTTKEIGKGTGLGLSISKGLIESHGGTLSIDEQSSNTSFVVTIPKKQKQLEKKAG